MTLPYKAGAAVLLVILTLCLECAGLVVLIRRLRRSLDSRVYNSSPLRFAALVTLSAAAVIVLHGLQVVLWASGYHWLCLPSWDSAFYFSANSYVTVGYSDVVLPSNWRMLGPLERITGVLMCGVTVSFLFAMVKRLVGAGADTESIRPMKISLVNTSSLLAGAPMFLLCSSCPGTIQDKAGRLRFTKGFAGSLANMHSRELILCCIRRVV